MSGVISVCVRVERLVPPQVLGGEGDPHGFGTPRLSPRERAGPTFDFCGPPKVLRVTDPVLDLVELDLEVSL